MILVTGANGYVGVHLVQKLCEKGRVVKALVRRGCSGDEEAFLSELGAEVVEADIEESSEVLYALEGVDTVVHLLGSIERPHLLGYRGMHTEKTRLLVRHFRASLPASRQPPSPRGSVPGGRIVYLSALGASPQAGNLYQQTKWEAEEEIRDSGLDYVIVRSSLIFGRETGRRDSKIVRKLATTAYSSRRLLIIGSGRNRLQPIYIADLVACLEKAVNEPPGCRETWEVGGPDALSMRDMCAMLLKAIGVERRITGVPYPIAYIAGSVARLLRGEGRINFEQIKMSRHDNICGRNRAMEILGGRMTDLEDGLTRTVERFGDKALGGVQN